eukprot:scaffold7373_cov232-Pinguiococcus_pyrenoidosus.AAC.2
MRACICVSVADGPIARGLERNVIPCCGFYWTGTSALFRHGTGSQSPQGLHFMVYEVVKFTLWAASQSHPPCSARAFRRRCGSSLARLALWTRSAVDWWG